MIQKEVLQVIKSWTNTIKVNGDWDDYHFLFGYLSGLRDAGIISDIEFTKFRKDSMNALESWDTSNKINI